MSLVEVLKKFAKSGFASLSEEEKSFLKENKSLLSPAQVKDLDGQADAEGDGEDEDGEGEGDGAGEGEGEGDEEGGIDEKALKSMISKSVQSEISKKMDAISDELVAKFVSGVKDKRKKVSDVETKHSKEVQDETRNFLKALVSKDATVLKAFKEKAAQFGTTADDDRGGYTVPETLMTEILRIAEKTYGVARREMLYLPFSGAGESRKIPTLASSVSVFWVGQGVKKTGTGVTFDLVTQTLKKLVAIIPFTEELLEDSAIDITGLVAALFAEAVAKEEYFQFFCGTGAPWTGLLKNANLNVVNLGAGEDITDMTADDLLDMQDATPSGALVGAKYYLNREALSIIRKLKGTDGQYVWQRPADGMPGTIWNCEYVLVEAMPGKTAGLVASTAVVLFGNLKVGAIFGDKQQLRIKLLDQATITDGDGTTVINLAEQDMIAFRVEERVGYVVALPKAMTVLKTGVSS